jgi:hypothetical protein
MPNFATPKKKSILLLSVFFCLVCTTVKSQSSKANFNIYLIRAADTIQKHWALRGYDINGVFTHDMSFGRKTLKASKPALTMCVAAQLEIIITALNIYAKETKDASVYDYLPVKHWVSTETGTLKDLIWVNSGSQGTAYALQAYGMGTLCRFDQLLPGSFVNINRNNRTGHAVLFLSYIDGAGNELKVYSDKVKGFKYFSSQGKGPGVGGFGYRYAFFEPLHPTLPAGKKRDCGIIFSNKQSLLNCGMMLFPSQWNKQQRDAKLAEIRNFHSLTEDTVNPKYAVQNTTDD